MMDIKFDADTKVADSQRQYEMLKAGYEAEVNTKVSSQIRQHTYSIKLALFNFNYI